MSIKFFIVIAILAISSVSLSWTLTRASNQKGWAGEKLLIHVNPTNCRADFTEVLNKAINLWNSVPNSRLKLERGVDSAATPADVVANLATESFVAVCDPNFDTTLGYTPPDSAASVGGSLMDPATRHLIRGDLLINMQVGSSGNIEFYDSDVAAVVVAHEIGHVLGLGHSSSAPALMHFTIGYKDNLSLSEDDINGMTYLYGRKEISGGDDVLGGCATLRKFDPLGSNKSNTLIALLLLLLLLPLLTAVKLRRRPKLVKI